jgi:hypothetical protein
MKVVFASSYYVYCLPVQFTAQMSSDKQFIPADRYAYLIYAPILLIGRPVLVALPRLSVVAAMSRPSYRGCPDTDDLVHSWGAITVDMPFLSCLRSTGCLYRTFLFKPIGPALSCRCHIKAILQVSEF